MAYTAAVRADRPVMDAMEWDKLPSRAQEQLWANVTTEDTLQDEHLADVDRWVHAQMQERIDALYGHRQD